MKISLIHLLDGKELCFYDDYFPISTKLFFNRDLKYFHMDTGQADLRRFELIYIKLIKL